MNVRKITSAVIIATIVIAILYDIWAAVMGGVDGTISAVIFEFAHKYPIVAFGAGLLCGHLFFPVRRAAMVLPLLLIPLSCADKTDVGSEDSTFQRPDTYRVSDTGGELDRMAGQEIPRNFRSPLPVLQAIRIEKQVGRDIENLTGAAMKADESLDRMVKFAAWMLKRKGEDYNANLLLSEYATQFSGIMLQIESRSAITGYRDIGDHTPLLAWLDKWYKVLEDKLGPAVMRATKLEHLKILNYSIPVVFNPTGKNGEWWDQKDYRDHFAGTRHTFFYPAFEHEGFAGVVTYWTVWAACTGATYGAGGALPFMCAPVGDVSSFVVGKWIAPPISDKIYCKYAVCE